MKDKVQNILKHDINCFINRFVCERNFNIIKFIFPEPSAVPGVSPGRGY